MKNLDLPQVELKIFSNAKHEVENFYVFGVAKRGRAYYRKR